MGLVGLRGRRARCSQVRGWMSEYLDGRLGPGQARALESHLEACPECREELAALRETVGWLQGAPQVAAPRSFALTPAMVRPRPRPGVPGWAWGLATAAAALLLAVVLAGDLMDFLPQGAPPLALTQEAPAPSPAPQEGPAALAAPEPTPQPRAEGLKAAPGADLATPQAGEMSAPSPQRGGGPWRPLEYGLGGLTFLLGSKMLLSAWQARRKALHRGK